MSGMGLTGRLPAVLCALGMCAGAALAAPPNLDEVQASLRDMGVEATLTLYFDCKVAEDGTGFEGVATGEPRWVEIAQRLMRGADACQAASLQAALGLAMREAPRVVLPLVGRTARLAPEQICLPAIPRDRPVAARLRDLSLSRLAISSVGDARLADARQACLDHIAAVEAPLRAAAGASR